MHLLYLYKKSSKKHGELKNFYHLLQGQFEMDSAGVRPLKAIGTRCIDHKIAALGRVIEKFGLYTHNICIIPSIQQRNPKIAQHYKESLRNKLMLNFYYDVHYLLTF